VVSADIQQKIDSQSEFYLSSMSTLGSLGLNKMSLQIVDFLNKLTDPDVVYFFRGSPDDQIMSIPSKSSVTQTRGGFWVEDFGLGANEIKLSGTTGYKRMSLNGKQQDGKENFEQLLMIYQKYNDIRRERRDAVPSVDDPRAIVLVLSIGIDDKTLIVHPTNFVIKKSKSQPLLYYYDISFVVLGDYATYRYAGRTYDPLASKIYDGEARRSLIASAMDGIMKGIMTYPDSLRSPELTSKLSEVPSLGTAIDKTKKSATIGVGNLTEGGKVTTEQVSSESLKVLVYTMPRNAASANDPINKKVLSRGQLNVLTYEKSKTSLQGLNLSEFNAESPKSKQKWTTNGVKDFVGGLGGAISGMTAAINTGASVAKNEMGATFGIIRTARQLQTCVMSLIKYPELFTQSLENKFNQAISSQSGCSTTLGLEI